MTDETVPLDNFVSEPGLSSRDRRILTVLFLLFVFLLLVVLWLYSQVK